MKKNSSERGPPPRIDHVAIVGIVALVVLARTGASDDSDHVFALLALVVGSLYGPGALRSVARLWRR